MDENTELDPRIQVSLSLNHIIERSLQRNSRLMRIIITIHGQEIKRKQVFSVIVVNFSEATFLFSHMICDSLMEMICYCLWHRDH